MTLHPPLLILVVLIGYAVCAGDDCGAGKADLDCEASQARRPKQCYHCSTYSNDKYCADPFNKSHPDVRTIRCEGSCAKWVRKPKHGPNQYVRTCSTNLNLQMPVSLVCMKESRPGDGHLCFCNKKACNAAPASAATWRWVPLLLLALACFLSSDWMFLGNDDDVIFTRYDKRDSIRCQRHWRTCSSNAISWMESPLRTVDNPLVTRCWQEDGCKSNGQCSMKSDLNTQN